MSDVWSSLYFRTDDSAAVAKALAIAVSSAAYTAFNPFTGAPGRTYRHALRLFVAPSSGGWVRVLGHPDSGLLPDLSYCAPLLWAELEGGRGRLDAWNQGKAGRVEAIFGVAPAEADSLPPSAPASVNSDAFDALPDNVKAMNTNPKQAQAMMNRLSGGLLKKAGGDPAEAAAALQGNPPQWDSRDGRWVAALLDTLEIPNWAKPDLVLLRDAYQLHLRRQLRPAAALYHGDQEAMDAVPNALDYTPVYAGKA